MNNLSWKSPYQPRLPFEQPEASVGYQMQRQGGSHKLTFPDVPDMLELLEWCLDCLPHHMGTDLYRSREPGRITAIIPDDNVDGLVRKLGEHGVVCQSFLDQHL